MSDATTAPEPSEVRVLVLAPTRRDADITQSLLTQAGLASLACGSLTHLAAEVRAGAGAVLLTDTALDAPDLDRLLEALSDQPSWSDLPVLALVRAGAFSASVNRLLEKVPSLTIVERPIQMRTLLSLVVAAVRSRRRQYQVRESLESSRRAKEEADRANAAKDRFLAVLSHELRTPLAPVLLATAMLAEDPDTPPAVAEQLAMIRRNVELETKLIDDLLDLSRVENGKLRLDLRPVRLNSLARHVIEMCTSEIHRKSIKVRFESLSDRDLVAGDPARLQQALWNLLKNAIKFTPVGGAIDIRTDATADAVVLTVKDTGVGIPPEALPHLFDAFEQGSDAVTKQFGGLGLGLAITRAVVELHNGRISASSAGAGQGAEFRVELPRAKEAEHADARPVSPATEPSRRGLHLLVVEDHADTASLLARLLRFSGHSSKLAGTAAAALALAARERFDLVLSDVGLPDRSGFELMRELRDRYGLVGVCMSGYGMEDDVKQGREAGFVEHLVKPVAPHLLAQVLGRLATARPPAPAAQP